MSEFTIEKNVPLNDPRTGPGPKPFTYPFEDMHIGDSFLIRVATISEAAKARSKLYQEVRKIRKTVRTFSISTRTCPEGFRVWRFK